MVPSKTAVSDDAFAFTSQRYRNEAKALQTQLQFNRNVPAVPENLALRFSHPRPIIIEKLKASSDQRNLVGSEDLSLRSSGMFAVVSEERLKLAVRLAKRDIKQRRLEEQVKQVFGDVVSTPLWTQKSQPQKTEVFASRENKNTLKSQTQLACQQRLAQPSRGESASSDTSVHLCLVKEGKPVAAVLDSPPTRDTGPDHKPNLNKKEHQNMQEVQRLQKELRNYVQKIEDFIKKGRDRELLDPENEQRLCTRRQQQAARSARMLYVLQQQVKEIQDDLEKLSPHTIKHTKKSRAVSRLAAAHRGAVRTLQAFASQFTDQTDEQIPAHYKELGSLIRQLSLCSAKLEGDSSISEAIIDILLQVEDLNSLLESKQTPKTVKKCISASKAKSPRNTETYPDRKHFLSPKGENKPLTLKRQHGQEPKKPPCARSLLTVQQANSCAHILHNKYQEESGPPISERNATLQGSTDVLVRARAVKKESVLESAALKKKGVLLLAKPQGMLKSLKSRWAHPPGKHTRFQEPTIAFQLKENKRPVKESKMPRVPSKPAPRSVSPKRLARLEARNSRGVKVLTDLCRGEMEKIQKLRSQTVSPDQCADKAEEIQEWSEPPFDRTQVVQQVATNADILSEKLLDDLLEDTAQELWSMDQHDRLQAEALPVGDTYSLESMLQRMEEIEMYQEAVRRRVTQIVYSDSHFWAQQDNMEQQMASTARKLTPPHPVQITKLIRHGELETDILFEKPFDSTDIDENKEAEEKFQTGNDILQPLLLNSLQKAYSVSLSVPSNVLQSILDYNSRYKHHLKLISHEAVGSFDPWQIAESLAEQLTEEALCDVAAELQDVCEDYAEAVFTSEFLQPVQ
ncbi:protein moonraker isoform X2 [Geospiza fortis]|uniref:Protein moonraker isoform X2 n=1 Tax=Geospiza fortis TaxID=48883 RepID=A0A8N5EP90_GEOFO|nr:protein moonraker isoform X2 [Camarhynchus parvulus]XP_030915619.1 protein moonraker isoform X2 [Geospiza fortis]